MNIAKIALSAIAFTIASGAAMAQEAVPAHWNESYTPNVAVSPSAKTRAEVVGELIAARQSGELSRYDNDSYSPAGLMNPAPKMAVAAKQATPAATVGGITRAQVRAELMAARRSGEINAFDSDPIANNTAAAPIYAGVSTTATTVAAR